MFEITDFQKIGVGLAGFGVAFLFLGVLLLFDKGLLALGNILFLSGLAFVIGLERTFRFFFQRHKIRGTLAFFGGIAIVIVGFPLIGIIVETYGFILLFSLWIAFQETRAGQLCELLCWAPWQLLLALRQAAILLYSAVSMVAKGGRLGTEWSCWCCTADTGCCS
ncbi:vesicle transport protein GOT1B isoform X1 [Rhipicephalus microplus]|uniref:vesicle transport protein GOT1B isoform X1 n=1 Tax=Rhipicephalus microplus TaxID=6941 RepID=UPI001886E4A5|nr:vesicle transport protein GOT1B-like isoform X1 [Rhipicephalus microplus]